MPAVAGRGPDLDRGGDREAIRVEEGDNKEREGGLQTSFLLGNFLSFPLFAN